MVYCGEERVSFTEWLREGRWYFITLSHTRSKLRAAKRTKGKISLWINGIQKEELSLSYPPSVSCLTKAVFNGKHGGKLKHSVTHSWNLGPIHLYGDHSLTNRESFLQYLVGPNYVGAFPEDMSPFQIFDLVNEENAPIHFGNLDLINNLSSCSLQHLNDKIMLLYSPRNNGSVLRPLSLLTLSADLFSCSYSCQPWSKTP